MPWQKLALGVILFLWIYSLAPTFLPIQSKRLITLGGLFVFALMGILHGRRLPVDRAVLQVGTLFLITGTWVLAGSIRSGFETPTYLAAIVLTFGESFLGGLVVATLLVRHTRDLDRVIRLFHLIILIQALLIIFSFLSPWFRQLTASFLPARGNIHALDPIRVRGLSHSSGAHMAALQAMGLLMVAYLLPRTRRLRGQLFLLASTLPLLLSILFTGRTGFVMLPFALAVWAAVMLFRIRFRLGHLAAYLGLFLLGVGALWGFNQSGITRTQHSTSAVRFAFDAAERRLTSEFSAPASQGYLRSRTLNVLFGRMWIIPESEVRVVVGDPKRFMTVPSDLGVIRHLHAGGLIGMFFVYGSVLATFLVISSRVPDRGFRIFLWAFFAWLALLELKEPMMINHLFAGIYFVLFWFTFLIARQRRPVAGQGSRQLEAPA